MRVERMMKEDPMKRLSERLTRGRTVGLLALIVLFSLVASCRSGREPASPAELILKNAAVYTMNKAQPLAEAAAVAGGKSCSWVRTQT
jgi:hypothetical protein